MGPTVLVLAPAHPGQEQCEASVAGPKLPIPPANNTCVRPNRSSSQLLVPHRLAATIIGSLLFQHQPAEPQNTPTRRDHKNHERKNQERSTALPR
jgi:hypothetical protein